jgi:hypothetical protein
MPRHLTDDVPWTSPFFAASANADRLFTPSRLYKPTRTSHTHTVVSSQSRLALFYPSTADRALRSPTGCRAMAALPLLLDAEQRPESGAASELSC